MAFGTLRQAARAASGNCPSLELAPAKAFSIALVPQGLDFRVQGLGLELGEALVHMQASWR